MCKNCGFACTHPLREDTDAVAPTCGTPGKGPGKKCATCDFVTEEGETIAATGHKFEERVGYVSGQEPTCTTGGKAIFKCLTCDETIEREVGAHKTETLLRVAATCESAGYAIFKCTQEGCTFMDYEVYEKLSHTEEIVPAVAATCTATGLTQGKRCATCGETLVAQTVTSKLQHQYTVSVQKKDPTCTADGYTAHKKCATCDATEGKNVVHLLGHNFVDYICSRCHVRDGSCLHTNGVITIRNATCTTNGEESFVCPDCGYSYRKTLTSSGHSSVNGVCTTCGENTCNHSRATTHTTHSTCTTPGVETRTCSCGWTSTKTLPLAAHNYQYGICQSCGRIGSTQSTADSQGVFVVG